MQQNIRLAPDKNDAGSAGTTECFKLARDYLDGFQAPVDIVSGNHDLEGLGEFATDGENLAAFQVIISPNSVIEHLEQLII